MSSKNKKKKQKQNDKDQSSDSSSEDSNGQTESMPKSRNNYYEMTGWKKDVMDTWLAILHVGE